ncbi:hypothetical protein I350_03179 [Cryptococcus amylolentus CBS 6273]|uniref:Uncharacterized protein n=1 Tax=Cryptococcus amylolentus CBS 6273 TaxID=1296118 RepID=A0A1E3K9B9_9TREE|nr:hypothetical protein I350_03179 [Cryptococcus amylolentus CBS 6273]
MSQIHSKLSSPRATAPTIPCDISSLDPLPVEIQNVVYDKLLADPDLTLTLAGLSKSHYITLIPRLYERVEVTDKVVERGLFEGLLTGANHLEAPGEGRLPTKRDLLENCKSLVVASLPAFDAITDAIQAWKALLAKRRETGTVPDELDGIFNRVTHLAWGPDLIDAICRDATEMDENGVNLGDRHHRRCLSFKNVWNVCLRLPYPLPKTTCDEMMSVIPNYIHFGGKVDKSFIRYHNCKSDPHMRSVEYPLRGRLARVDLVPAGFEEGVDPLIGQARDIVTYCVGDMHDWTNFDSDDLDEHAEYARNPMHFVFTNIGTTIAPDGTLAHLPPDLKQAVLEKLQRKVRHEVRAKLLASAPSQVWAADRIHLRGHEECKFCPQVSH